ncbi:Glycosyltransferase [hydrothermal vent metagenome]|uniref:Glycosyltransferase n=1 Tax=hydrothermal vent metagenome TaxID=652676 RepID=A0A3B0WFY6_9ZZZZ
MKTILHIIDTTGPGGAETIFIDLATRLPKEKYRSVVVIRGKGWVYDELCRRGVKPFLLDAKGSFNWRYLLALRKLIKREGIDLIQSHLLGSNVYSALVGLLARKPVIATFHGAVDIDEAERFMGLKFGLINRGSSKIIAVSESLRHEIANRTPLRASKTDIIYNGIDTVEFEREKSNEFRQQFGWAEEDFIIGSLGNIRPAKAYDILLQAAALLDNSTKTCRFVIAGQSASKGKSSRLYKKLLELRESLNLQNHVKFVGFVNDPADFLSKIDLFLLSSSSEGFSISTIQAMASSLPVIATRSGGPEEIVTHKKNGWLIEKNNPVVMAEAISLLSCDPDKCAQLASNAKVKVGDSFGLAAMLRAYQALYAVFI